MHILAYDHVVLPVTDLEAAAMPFEKLGLRLTPAASRSTGNRNRVFLVPAGRDQEGEFYVELLAGPAAGTPGALSRVVVVVEDTPGVESDLRAAGIAFSAEDVAHADGRPLGRVVRAETAARAGCDLSFLEYADTAAERVARHRAARLFEHGLGLRRMDHLAALPADLDAATRFWNDVLGLPTFGEVRGRGLVIRQMKAGDGILELLGPETPDSPLASRPPGFMSMTAFEVASLDGAVAAARAAGFTVADPSPGVLPGTLTTTISPDQTGGLALQLLEYV